MEHGYQEKFHFSYTESPPGGMDVNNQKTRESILKYRYLQLRILFGFAGRGIRSVGAVAQRGEFIAEAQTLSNTVDRSF